MTGLFTDSFLELLAFDLFTEYVVKNDKDVAKVGENLNRR